MSQITEEIKSKINLVDLVNEYVRLQKAGINWKGLCPFHSEKTPSFVVSEEKQIWHCFGCGKGGDVFSFLMEIEGIEFKEALKMLADKAGVALPKYSKTETFVSSHKDKILEILELATKFYEKQLWEGAGQKIALPYLKKRGLENKTIRLFRLGYAPLGWRYLQKFLLQRGYSLEEIKKTGLIVAKENLNKSYDRFRHRIIFPIANLQGQIIGHSARVAPGGDESQAKYVNTPETEVYHKSQILYGIDKAKLAIKQNDQVVLEEGNMDVIASYQAGINYVVAVSGTALTLEQLKILKRYTNNLKLFFDMDEAGQAAALKSTRLAFSEDFNVYIITISSGKDAADLAQKDAKQLFKSIKKSQPAMQYFISQFTKKYGNQNVAGQKKIIEASLDLISYIANPIEKQYWLKKISQKFDVDISILTNLLDSKTENKNKKLANNAKHSKITAIVSNSFKEQTKERKSAIRNEILGLILNDSNLWKEITLNEKRYPLLYGENDLLKDILKIGTEVRFDFDKLRNHWTKKEKVEKINQQYFKARYIIENEKFKEINTKAIEKNFKKLYNQLKVLIIKDKTIELERRIKEAEKRNDKISRQKLMEEFLYLLSKNKE